MPNRQCREKRGAAARCCVLLMACITLTWAAGQEVVLHLKNGDRLSGTLISEDTNRVVLSNAWTKEITVPLSEIVKREVIPAQPIAPAATAPPVPIPPPAVPPPAVPAPVKAKPPKRWFVDAQLGANVLFSEKNQQIYTGRLKLTYAHGHFRNVLDYLVSYGETDNVISANRMDGSIKTDFDISPKFFVYNLGTIGYDQIRKIDMRYEIGPGLGYHLIRHAKFVMNVETGVNYQEQHLDDGSSTEQFYHRFAEDATWTFSPRLSLDERFEFFPAVGNWGNYRFRFESNLRYLLANNVTLNLTVIDLFDRRPAQTVSRNDLQLRSSLGVKF